MTWQDFHHPNISWPVVRRRTSLEFMELLELSALFLSRGGWGLLNRSCYPNDRAYSSAKSRLKKRGLIASRSSGGEAPHLKLTDQGKDLIPDYFNPERFWDQTWNKIWYILVYDIPEVDRKYRDILRKFLKKKRMGCLQQSVWVTPKDIRPDFDDLTEAANIDAFAFLFEARTVLGLPNARVVEEAWNTERIQKAQEHFCFVTEKNLTLVRSGLHSPPDISRLLRMTLDAYHSAMVADPLLPDALLPPEYAGKRAYNYHKSLLEEINKQAECYI